jgi:hypothetical protein
MAPVTELDLSDSQFGAIVEANAAAIQLDTQLRPQTIQVDAHRPVFHSHVQRVKNTYANRPVPGSERILKVPVFADIPTGVNNAAKGLLQTLGIACLAADLHVR